MTYPVFKRILTLLSLFPVFHLPSWSAPTISRFFDGRDFPRKNWTSQNFITLSKSVKITRFSVSNILLRSLPLRSQLRILKLLNALPHGLVVERVANYRVTSGFGTAFFNAFLWSIFGKNLPLKLHIFLMPGFLSGIFFYKYIINIDLLKKELTVSARV